MDRIRIESQELSKQLDPILDLVKEQKETSFYMQQEVECLTDLVKKNNNNDLKSLGEEVGLLGQKGSLKGARSTCVNTFLLVDYRQ